MKIQMDEAASVPIGQGYLMGGNTHRSIKNNTANVMYDICKSMNVSFRERQHSYIVNGKPVHIFGGTNVATYRPIRGLNLAGAWIDEATEVHEEYVDTIEDRLRLPASTSAYFMNPSSPYHPFKQKYIDVLEHDTVRKDKTLKLWSHLLENPHLTDDKKLELLDEPNKNSFRYKRMKLGLWAPAEGLVFPISDNMIKDWQNIFDVKPTVADFVGIDIGVGTRTIALYFVKTKYGYHIIDEYIWSRDTDGQPADEETHLNRMQLKGYRMAYLSIDPNWLAFQVLARNKGYNSHLSIRDVKPGLELTGNALESGKLTIDKRCINLLKSCSTYHFKVGTDDPDKGKGDDDEPDAMRYGATAAFGLRRTTVV